MFLNKSVLGLVSEPESKVEEERTTKENWRTLFWHIMSVFTPFSSIWQWMLTDSGCAYMGVNLMELPLSVFQHRWLPPSILPSITCPNSI